MVKLMERMIFGYVLRPDSQAILKSWMLGATTGTGRLMAGLPPGWQFGHKTGTSERDANNDVGFALPPVNEKRKPILIVSFSNGPGALTEEAEISHAKIATQVFTTLL